VGRALRFAVTYVLDLILSSVQVAIDVCRPRLDVCPGVVGIPLKAESDAEITVLANLISLTPGTLSLDVSPDRRTLFVHAMDLEGGPDALRVDIRETLEKRVLDLMRGPVDPNADGSTESSDVKGTPPTRTRPTGGAKA